MRSSGHATSGAPLNASVMRTETARAGALKKRHERSALDRFLELLKTPVPESIEPDEEPDFVLTFGGRRVGIEMTDLYWSATRAGRPRQEQESLRRRVVEAAERLYADRNLPPVHVSVHFNDQYVLNKTAIQLLAAQIVTWAAARVPRIGESFEEQYDWVNRDYFPEHLHSLRIYRHAPLAEARFSAPDADYAPQLDAANVEHRLQSKNSRHRQYLRKCDEAWLVIGFNTDRLSTTFQISQVITDTVYETPFSRVFLLQLIAPHLFELKRTYADSPDA